MAVRIRQDNNQIVCAAKSKELPGDVYIDDGLHYALAEELRVLSVCGYTPGGADIWEFHKVSAKRREGPEPIEELRFLLPSGRAVLFLPIGMTSLDFDILSTYLDAHKRSSELAIKSNPTIAAELDGKGAE